MNRSPTRYEFNIKRYRENLAKDPNDITAKGMINHYLDYEEQDKEHAVDPEWCKDNLEYDLRTTEWIIEKAKCDKVYAQHLYAAICNNEFQRNDVWPILTDKKWGASWRHAGAIVADMREQGDYMDWYCSGIQNDDPIDDEVFQNMDDHQKRDFFETKSYVGESVVTDEIREDLFKLGWIVIEDNYTD
jgi:hypothetical protein